MTRARLISGAVLFIGVLVWGVCASDAVAARFTPPQAGFPMWDSGTLDLSAAVSDSVIDSLRAPAGMLIEWLSVSAATATLDSIVIGWVKEQGAAQDTSEIDKTLLLVIANTSGPQPFPFTCEKIYFSAPEGTADGASTGNFMWSVGFRHSDQDSAGVFGVSW